MATCIEITSKEMIKPSSPTPPHLRNHKLFLMDQTMPRCYISLIFFFQYDDDSSISEKSQQFKESLSRTLTLFYPLAGRIRRNNLSVDCNDEGVEVVHAFVHTQLANVLKEPKMNELKNLVPEQAQEIGCDIPLAMQINFFDCGGIAIGVCMSHEVADVKSLAIFMHAWAATCRGGEEIAPPVYGAAPYPPLDLSKTSFTTDLNLSNKEKLTAKRIVFEKEKLDKLKEIASRVELKNPSRVEVVSASIWKYFIGQSKNQGNMFCSYHAIDLRPRMSKPITQNAFGNIVSSVVVAMLMPGDDKSFSNLVGKYKEAVKTVDGDFYLRNAEKGDYQEILDGLEKFVELVTKEGVEMFYFSSWRFPWYELNFGWGKPIYVCPGVYPLKNVVILMSSRCGEGVEAWINMLESDEFNEQSFYMDLDKFLVESQVSTLADELN
ncbi:hypothetical protein LIER_39247 [Lithospermum erythrorhizon]|uniref:Uncharacterized protein n=1 Tax=Lithospermum erythrorhizon TaxID=34254 RepID=A0AAV3QFW9_LITER